MRVKEIVFGGLLTSLSILIPLAFGGTLGVTIPPFSATIASHVPVMLAMTVSPAVAFTVAAGSALGFLIKLGPVIASRAAMHMIFAVIGAYLYKKGVSFPKVLIITLPIHAVSEALIVLLFGFTIQKAGIAVGVGTALHHSVDGLISTALFSAIGYMLPKARISKA